jgi:SAM-dependent methyltransferase
MMRQLIKDFVSIAATALPIREPIFEFGSLQVPGQEGFADLRPFFPGREYVGADMREGTGVDRVLDLHDIDLPEESVGAVLCLDTLEHVEYPRRALEEIHRILKPDGIAVITSVMCFRIHDHPSDYWRFTPEAFRSILKPFSHCFIGYAGRSDFPHTVVGVGFKGSCPPLETFTEKYEKWQSTPEVRQTLSTFTWLRRLLTPPILSRTAREALGLTRANSPSSNRK